MDIQATENQPVKRTREDIRSRMSEKYPDRDFSNDEDLADGVYGAFDEYEANAKTLGDENAKYKETEGKLTDMLTSNPESADMLVKMSQGKDPRISLIEMYGVEGLQEILNNPEKKEEVAEANKKYLDDVTKEKGYEEEYTNNLDTSLEAEKAAIENGEITQEDADKARESLAQKVCNYLKGTWTVDDLKSELKALNHDADVANAAQQGEVKGRNAQIVEKTKKRNGGDGMPQMGGGGLGRQNKPTADTSKLGALARNRRSIWG